MNKQLRIVALFALAFGMRLQAAPNEFITEIPLERGYAYSHYPFMRPIYDDCKNWYVDVWGAGVYRTANSAFLNENTTETGSIGGLFFGADSFTLASAFAPGTVIPGFPALITSLFTPSFSYNEAAAYFGMNIETVAGCDNQWHLGFRARVPFRSIKNVLDSCCSLEQPAVEDLFLLENERLACPDCAPAAGPDPIQTINNSFAIRLDLASALFQTQAGILPFERFVAYGTGAFPNSTKINGINVSDSNAVPNPIYLIYSPDAIPVGPWARTQPQVAALPCLDGAGTTAANARFCDANDYTALAGNTAAQADYWVAPQIDTNGAGALNIVAQAGTIRDRLTQLLQFHQINNLGIDALLSTTVFGFPLSFDTARRNGVGDFDTEFYARYDGCLCASNWFAEGIFGVRFPTASRNQTPGNLLLVPTGNNKHYELKLGGYLGWNTCDWFAVKVDAWYHWALKHTQQVAAPFAGATIFGIGPTVDASVSWQYFVGDVDFTFLIPCIDPLIGVNVGYQAWVKQRDHVSLDVTTALNPLGAATLLDGDLLEARTKRIAHTVKAEIFKQTCDWQLFAGWNHTFAGMNSLKNTDWYLGLEVYF